MEEEVSLVITIATMKPLSFAFIFSTLPVHSLARQNHCQHGYNYAEFHTFFCRRGAAKSGY